jgi:hypothetical protein
VEAAKPDGEMEAKAKILLNCTRNSESAHLKKCSGGKII